MSKQQAQTLAVRLVDALNKSIAEISPETGIHPDDILFALLNVLADVMVELPEEARVRYFEIIKAELLKAIAYKLHDMERAKATAGLDTMPVAGNA